MNIRHLRIFITVVDTGSMTGAAKKLFITQPSVSQTIMELESYYNVRLFERLSRKLYITREGKEFLGYARHIVSSFEKMEEKMRQSVEISRLRIGASVTVGTCVLSKLTTQFMDDKPDIKIESVIDNTSIVEDMVLKSKLDFGLVEGPIHSRDIVCKPFMDDELITISGSQHSLCKKDPLSLKELSKADLILREEGSGTRELFEDTMAAKGYNLNIIWTCNNSEAIKNAVASNIGLSVISKMAVKKELRSGILANIKVNDLKLHRKFNIIYHKNKYLSKAIKNFWDVCLLDRKV